MDTLTKKSAIEDLNALASGSTDPVLLRRIQERSAMVQKSIEEKFGVVVVSDAIRELREE